jgi:hypothetical protein
VEFELTATGGSGGPDATRLARAEVEGISPAAANLTADAAPVPGSAMSFVSSQIILGGDISDGAQVQLAESIQRFANDLCNKVREVESDQRAAGVENPEYTASVVIRANEKLRQHGDPRVTRLDMGVGLASPVSSGAAGILGSYLHSIWQAATFGAVTVVAIITIAIVLMKRGWR